MSISPAFSPDPAIPRPIRLYIYMYIISAELGGAVFNKVSGRDAKFRPGAKLLASLNAFGSDPARTKCSIPERAAAGGGGRRSEKRYVRH